MIITVDITRKIIMLEDDISIEELNGVVQKLFPDEKSKDIRIINKKILTNVNAGGTTLMDTAAFWNQAEGPVFRSSGT